MAETLPRGEGAKIDLGLSLFRDNPEDAVIVVVLQRDENGAENIVLYNDNKVGFTARLGMLSHAMHVIEHETEEA